MKNRKLADLFGQVLQEIRQLRNLSQEQLAFESELDRTYISQLERGKKMPTIQTLFSLSASLGVSPEEIIAQIHRHDGQWLKEPTGLNVALPIYATQVSCGQPISQDHRVEEVLPIQDLIVKNPGETFFVKASGDSMNPTISEGDYLVVDKGPSPQSGQIILAQVNNEFTVKRYYPTKEGVKLKSDNPHFADIFITDEQAFLVCGCVIAVIRLNP